MPFCESVALSYLADFSWPMNKPTPVFLEKDAGVVVRSNDQ